MPYRDDVEALAARHAALAAEVDVIERARDVAGAQLRHATERAKLRVLDNVRVASPCTVAWADMLGDERVRHCGYCDRDVFDLSAMTRDEVETLLLARGNLCIRYYRRADGTILLADCPIGARKRRSRRRITASVAIVAGTALACREAEHLVERLNREHDSRMLEEMGVTATMGEFSLDRPDVPPER